MGSEPIDYAAILADLESKKLAIEQAIISLRTALSIGAIGKIGEGMGIGMADSVSVALSPSFGAAGGEVPSGAFLGKSIPEAAKLYLAIVKRKQTSREIAEALLKGGIESSAKNFNTQVHSILDRARKSGAGIVKLDKSHWGLVEWYPASLRGIGGTEKRQSRPKRRKGKQSPSTSIPPADGMGPQQRIVQFLTGKGFVTAKDVADHAGLKIQTVYLVLSKLVATKKVEKSPDGHYKVV